MAATAPSDDLNLLTASARRSIADLRRAVRDARVPHGGRGSRVLEVVSAAIDELESRVAAVERHGAAAKDDADRRTAIRAARRVNITVLDFHEVAPWVEGARKSTLGLGIVYLIDEMLLAILGDTADVVVAPSARYMYSTLRDLRKLFTEALGVPFPDGPTAIVVAYPIHEPDSLFLHLIIAHELGHTTVVTKGLVKGVHHCDPRPEETKRWLGEVADSYRQSASCSQGVANAAASAILRDWITELLCDALGLAFLGPSFLFTTAAFSTPFEQEATDTHPAFPLRNRLLLDQLAEMGALEQARTVAPKTLDWIERNASIAEGAAGYYERLAKIVEQLAPGIRKTARDHVGARGFNVTEGELEELALLLNNDVLPAQRSDGTPPDCRALVFAGWRRAFERHGDDPAALAAMIGDRDLQRFLTKALEMSILLKAWLE